MNRKKRLKLLEAVALELIERVEALEAAAEPEPRKWRDTYAPAVDMDPRPPISDELGFDAPTTGVLWDDDEWRPGLYL